MPFILEVGRWIPIEHKVHCIGLKTLYFKACIVYFYVSVKIEAISRSRDILKTTILGWSIITPEYVCIIPPLLRVAWVVISVILLLYSVFYYSILFSLKGSKSSIKIWVYCRQFYTKDLCVREYLYYSQIDANLWTDIVFLN